MSKVAAVWSPHTTSEAAAQEAWLSRAAVFFQFLSLQWFFSLKGAALEKNRASATSQPRGSLMGDSCGAHTWPSTKDTLRRYQTLTLLRTCEASLLAWDEHESWVLLCCSSPSRSMRMRRRTAGSSGDVPALDSFLMTLRSL